MSPYLWKTDTAEIFKEKRCDSAMQKVERECSLNQPSMKICSLASSCDETDILYGANVYGGNFDKFDKSKLNCQTFLCQYFTIGQKNLAPLYRLAPIMPA